MVLLELANPLGLMILLLGRPEGLAHAIGDRAFVQGLVVRQHHIVLISHTQQQRPSLLTINRDLSNHFVEDLAEELLAHRAHALLLRCLSLQGVVQLLLQVDHIDGCRGLG